MTEGQPDVDSVLDHLFGSTPLPFIQAFLRKQKEHSKQIRIGVNRSEVRANLRDAILANRIGYGDFRNWLQTVEGWGKQHLYILSAGRGSLAFSHLLNTSGLRGFLKRKGLIRDVSSDVEPMSSYILDEVAVDDELARISWRCHSVDWERRKDLDERRELDDGLYEFRAYRSAPRRDVSRLIIRKTDGIVLCLVDLPVGGDHDSIKKEMMEVGTAVIAPQRLTEIQLSGIISALDQGAVSERGPRARRQVSVDVAPTQSRFRTDGALVEFKSTSQATGYTDSDAVRQVRKAMQITRFVGEVGKFRLNFEGSLRRRHEMVVSLSASSNRIYLFSRMSDDEVFALVDQLLPLATPSVGRR